MSVYTPFWLMSLGYADRYLGGCRGSISPSLLFHRRRKMRRDDHVHKHSAADRATRHRLARAEPCFSPIPIRYIVDSM